MSRPALKLLPGGPEMHEYGLKRADECARCGAGCRRYSQTGVLSLVVTTLVSSPASVAP